MNDIFSKLNKEQKKAATHSDGPLLIVAGAGTGKTTVIASRIIWLISQELAESDEILALTFTEKAAGEMEERVDKLLSYGYVDLWISTFHSFCERILKQRALDIGLPNDFKLLDQTGQWLLVRQNLDKFNLDYYRPLGNPTKFIHVLLKHFSRCKDEEINPDDYLKYAEKLRLNLDTAESGGGKIASSKSQTTNRFKISNSKFQIADNRISPSREPQTAGPIDISEIKRLEEVANAYHVYQQLLLDNNALDFGDLINYTLKLFRKRPNILKQYQERFKYILVDEFQDTNWAQYELIKLLLNKKQNLMVVCDDDQAIFKFRGASVSNILTFIKDFSKSRKIVLTENYRSGQEILDLSYKFIQLNNPNRLECKLNDSGKTASRFCNVKKKLHANHNPKVEVEHLQGKDLDEEVYLVIKKIVELKNRERSNYTPVGAASVSTMAERAGVDWSDFAILTRANNTATPFINALRRANIPFVFYSMRGLYTKPIILDVMALFKLLDNYHESSALFRALNIPVFKIDYRDFSKLTYKVKRQAISLFEILQKVNLMKDLSDKTRDRISNLLKLIDQYSKLAGEKSVGEIYVGLMEDSGYLKYLTGQETEESREQLRYLQQLYKKIRRFENETVDPKLKYFLEDMRLELESGEEGSLSMDLDAGPDMVRVMTIHSAKGLEFKYVFIVGMVDKKFPTIERKEPIEIPDELVKEILPEGDIHLQEERRLFYVAMTRAKQGLYFSSAEDYGGTRKKRVSRFIKELDLSAIKSSKLKINIHEDIKGLKYKNNLTLTTKQWNDKTMKQDQKETYWIPKHFSYSQLAAFNNCPLQYKYTFLLKIPIHGRGVFSFGKTMHGALQKFFSKFLEIENNKQASIFGGAAAEQRFVPTEDDLLKLYEESWIDQWYADEKIKREYKEKGRRILKEFYNKHKNNWPKVKELEKSFNLKLGDYTIRGIIDRIDDASLSDPHIGGEANNGIEGDCVEIVDYKTGGVKEEEKLTFNNKEQLILYQMAVEDIFKLKPIKLTFYYLDKNRAVSFLGAKQEKEKLKDKILTQIEKIKNSRFAPKPSTLCMYCDFFEICEYRQM